MERALEIALAPTRPSQRAIVNNLGVYSLLMRRLGSCRGVLRRVVTAGRALTATVRMSVSSPPTSSGSTSCVDAGIVGSPRRKRFIAECEAGSPHTNEGGARFARAIVRLGRGDPDGALADKLAGARALPGRRSPARHRLFPQRARRAACETRRARRGADARRGGRPSRSRARGHGLAHGARFLCRTAGPSRRARCSDRSGAHRRTASPLEATRRAHARRRAAGGRRHLRRDGNPDARSGPSSRTRAVAFSGRGCGRGRGRARARARLLPHGQCDGLRHRRSSRSSPTWLKASPRSRARSGRSSPRRSP